MRWRKSVTALVVECILAFLFSANGRVAAQSRWVDYDFHAGPILGTPTIIQPGKAVDRTGIYSDTYGSSYHRSHKINFGWGVSYRVFAEHRSLPLLHFDMDFVSTHDSWSVGHAFLQPAAGGFFPGNAYDFGDGLTLLRLAPSMRMADFSFAGISYYAQIGPTYLPFFPGQHLERHPWGENATRSYHNSFAASGEVGFGYRDFFAYFSYDHGLTAYSRVTGNLPTPIDDEYGFGFFHRNVRFGLSYHPRLTKRMRRADANASPHTKQRN